ncbi:MAG: S1C family serine protease [Planctomycetota bacterium]
MNLAILALLLPQETPPTPEPDPQVIEVPAPVVPPETPRVPLLRDQNLHLQAVVRGSALAELEKELIDLHKKLGPSLVEVQFSFSTGTDNATAFITSGVVLDNYGLVVVPIMLDEEQRDVTLDGILVQRMDGYQFKGELLDWNADYGISLLRVPELKGLAPQFWNGTWMQEGSVVMSMGNGLGLRASMQMGILAGRGRSIEKAYGLLQITNPVNLADNGGLLANRRGQVVGVLMTSYADLIAQRQEAMTSEEKPLRGVEEAKRAEGVSFAIPIEFVFRSFEDHFPVLPKPRLLGVMVNAEIRVVQQAGAEPSYVWQLRLTGVEPDSPADHAGLKEGDVILSLDGKPTTNLQELGLAIHGSPLATTIIVARDEKRLQLPLEFQRP